MSLNILALIAAIISLLAIIKVAVSTPMITRVV